MMPAGAATFEAWFGEDVDGDQIDTKLVEVSAAVEAEQLNTHDVYIVGTV